jgi:predicted transcriptional regulator
MASRINARIDDELAARIEALSKRTGKSMSAIVKAALDAYYEQVQASGKNPKAALQAAGFIGCAEGDRDLSTGYKDELARRWSKKA